MRNPFARLAKRAPARPSLRARAAATREKFGCAPLPRSEAASDPILATIAETRRLHVALMVAYALPQPTGITDPRPEQEATMAALNTYVEDVLLKTVPTTAAGRAALARYAVEYLKANGHALDEDQGSLRRTGTRLSAM